MEIIHLCWPGSTLRHPSTSQRPLIYPLSLAHHNTHTNGHTLSMPLSQPNRVCCPHPEYSQSQHHSGGRQGQLDDHSQEAHPMTMPMKVMRRWTTKAFGYPVGSSDSDAYTVLVPPFTSHRHGSDLQHESCNEVLMPQCVMGLLPSSRIVSIEGSSS